MNESAAETASVPMPRRNVVVCCDGTGNEFSTDRSNVLRLWRSLEQGPSQLTYYDPGVGTLGDARALTRWRKLLWKRLDAAIGLSVRDNVLEAYGFLVQNWREGDRLFFFGFSRGAYCVRALAGMIEWFGLVRPEHGNVLPYLWSLYSDENGEIGRFSTRMKAAGGIRKTMGRPVRVHFLGAFDTVSSFGWMWRPQHLPETAKVGVVDRIRHAVAIDERRRCFVQNLFVVDEPVAPPDPALPKRCIQMLFPGVHSDVGGGYPAAASGLAKLALEWMCQEADAAGLLFDKSTRRIELIGKDGREGPDVDGVMHDELTKWGWRVIELLPKTRVGWLVQPLLAVALLSAPLLLSLPAWSGAAVLALALLVQWCVRSRGKRRWFGPSSKNKPAPKLDVHPSVGQRRGYRPPNLP